MNKKALAFSIRSEPDCRSRIIHAGPAKILNPGLFACGRLYFCFFSASRMSRCMSSADAIRTIISRDGL